MRRPPYEAAARAKGMPLFAFVMGDFLNPPGETVTIEAVAKDRPGIPGSLSVPWLIA